MPKIPTYTAGKLASEQTGVTSLDQSGQILSEGIAKVAGKAAQLINESLVRQRNLLQRAELTKKVSLLDSDMAIAAAEIRQQYVSDPDEGLKQLDAKRKEIFGLHKNSIDDPEVKLQFDAMGTDNLVRGSASDRIWAFNENNKIIQKTHYDRMNQDAAFAGQTDNIEEVLEKAFLLDQDSEDFNQAWGGAFEGGKVVDAGQESMITAYFEGQLAKGNAFKVLKEIEDGRFGPTEERNALIRASKLKTMKNEAKRLALVGKDDAAAMTLMQSVQSNFDIDGMLQQSIVETSEQINALSFQIKQTREEVALGVAGEDELKILEQQQKILENVRGTQLSRHDAYIEPDKAEQEAMTKEFLNLFKQGNVKKPFKATLEEVFELQRKLTANRDSLGAAFVTKYSALVDGAFKAEIEGSIKGSKLSTKRKFPWSEKVVAEDPKRLTSSKKLQKVFGELIDLHKPEEGNEQLFETMQFFMDGVTELLDITKQRSMSMLPEKNIEELMTVARRKAQLQKLGLPVTLEGKSVLYKNGQVYMIVGFDPDGMPLVDPVK